MPITSRLTDEVRAVATDVIATRRDLHRHPEMGFRETRTSGLIERKLRACGWETRRIAGTGILGILRGEKPGPTMLMRADIDALPVRELNDVPYRSQNEGVMHACGHDGHVAAALGAAAVLARRRHALTGVLKLMFQPAEEGPGGAMPMIEAGILDKPKVDAAFAMHMWNDLPVGKIGVRSGPVFASADEYTIRIRGRGGHGAAPHQTVDPVVAAAHVTVALQSIVSRRVHPLKSAVVTVGQIHGGVRHNIISDAATLNGTVRALEQPVRAMVKRELYRIARGVAASLGATAEIEWRDGYPPTVNDRRMAELARAAAVEVVGARNVIEQEITMGAEDMSYVLERVPGCYWLLGSANTRKGLAYPHHSARFDFDESSLPIGVEVWVKIAERLLGGASRR
ncbi:MAG: amidohydrolase [Planctomycetes bacterium]|nr:amidohydrolase [Planctomycetota bacterium]